MASIGYQLRLVHDWFPEASVLEVGVGTGLTTQLLRTLGHAVSTLDVDIRLSPDLVGSVTEIPAPDENFGVFLCSQVLEHLSWEDAAGALRELKRVSQRGGVISVPTNRPTWLVMKFDSRSWGTRRVTLGSRTKQPLRTAREHHWELEANRTTRDFKHLLRQSGFSIEFELQPCECMYHQFFVVKK